ncbi:MAG: bifunctional glutamate N-acetyltransferase/amino-acid acetyltransferase ArgJ, partial [Hyphomonadaceae bacterium]
IRRGTPMSSGLDLPVSPLAPDRFPDLPEVAGVQMTTHSVGLYGGRRRDDLLVAHFPEGAAVAGMFTTSQTRSADVDWCRESLAAGGGRARALVVNAGNSNAFTGAAGVAKNAATVARVAEQSGCAPHEVYLSATGVIGEPLPPDLVAGAVASAWASLSAPNWERAANAIRTTDTFAKGAGTVTEIAGRRVGVAGFCKGSGMIAPNMATMLAYVFTDAPITQRAAQVLLARHGDATFNCVTVDGDTSTSDTLLLFATGQAGGDMIDDPDDPRLAGFSEALFGVLKDLAIQLVRDGEGASKLIAIEVTGAETDAAARTIAASIANSPLVKTAMAAGDANWGRVVMAVGKAGEAIERDRIAIWFGDHKVAEAGARSPGYSEAAATAAASGKQIDVRVDVGVGDGRAMVWTCDLTDGYITINGAYRT